MQPFTKWTLHWLNWTKKFAKQALNWLREVQRIKGLKPIKRALICGEEILAGLTCHVDGGVAGYGAVVYVTVKTELILLNA